MLILWLSSSKMLLKIQFMNPYAQFYEPIPKVGPLPLIKIKNVVKKAFSKYSCCWTKRTFDKMIHLVSKFLQDFIEGKILSNND